MTEKEKQKEILVNLRSKDEKKIMEAFESIRLNGKAEMLPDIIQLLKNDYGVELIEKIYCLLNELKDQKCVPFLMKEITSKDYSDKQMARLISSCWQSGLDFSGYLQEFTEIVVKNNFEVAFEAFTLIEVIADEYHIKNTKEEIAYVKRHLEQDDPLKKNLIHSLIGLLEQV